VPCVNPAVTNSVTPAVVHHLAGTAQREDYCSQGSSCACREAAVDAQRISVAMLGIGASLPLTRPTAAGAAPAWQFHLREATIADVDCAIRARQIAAVHPVNLRAAKERIIVREM
jgi:hypothetical protein